MIEKIRRYLKRLFLKIISVYRDSVYHEFPVLDEEGNILYYEIYLPRSEKAIQAKEQKGNDKETRDIE